MLRVVRCLALIAAFLSAGCAEPPHKEMNQAQGAIDAARSAGADRFAAVELIAATDALKRSEEAAAAGDYRQALNHALDSRERAQNAAKMAVDGRADARGQAERAISEVATLLTQAHAQLEGRDAARMNPRTLRGPRDIVASAEKMLQDARTALKVEDYAAVTTALNGAAADLQAALKEFDAPGDSRPAPRKR